MSGCEKAKTVSWETTTSDGAAFAEETLAAHRGIRGSRLSWMGGLSPRGNEPGEAIEFGRQADYAYGEG